MQAVEAWEAEGLAGQTQPPDRYLGHALQAQGLAGQALTRDPHLGSSVNHGHCYGQGWDHYLRHLRSILNHDRDGDRDLGQASGQA